MDEEDDEWTSTWFQRQWRGGARVKVRGENERWVCNWGWGVLLLRVVFRMGAPK